MIEEEEDYIPAEAGMDYNSFSLISYTGKGRECKGGVEVIIVRLIDENGCRK